MTMRTQRLSIEELAARVRASDDVVERSHCQAIWLLAKGHTTAEVAEVTALTPRWINKLARRYEREGAATLGDQRRHNRGGKPLLSAADLAALRDRLQSPPEDGGLWTGPKVARWMALRLGLTHVHAPRGWEALKKIGWSVQAPRPRNPKSATPEEQAAFKKSSPTRWPRKPTGISARRSKSGLRMNIGSA